MDNEARQIPAPPPPLPKSDFKFFPKELPAEEACYEPQANDARISEVLHEV